MVQQNRLFKRYSIFNLADEDNEDGVALNQNIKLLQDFIHNLKELDKALMLLYLEDKSYEEIGEIFDFSTCLVFE